jgi:hypothetical protein
MEARRKQKSNNIGFQKTKPKIFESEAVNRDKEGHYIMTKR